MKRLLKPVILLVVLTFCLPTCGEVLVYKYSHNFSDFELKDADNSQWDVQKCKSKGFFVVDVNYPNGTIQNGKVKASALILYGKNDNGKWLEVRDFRSLQIVRLTYGLKNKVKWLFIDDDSDVDDLDADGILVVEGEARYTNIGFGISDKREIAMGLKGYAMANETKSGGGIAAAQEGNIKNGNVSLRYDSKWTKKANAADAFNQNFEAALFDEVNGIIASLESKGYIARLGSE